MVSAIISKVILVIFGTLYPAYRSYKAIKNKDVREYVKWMMYWIIFAFFTTAETFADFFLAWLPLYYEIKIVFIIWLLSPATKGSSILYRKFVHPRLQKHEKAIDKYISQAQRNSYATLMDVGKKGLSVATDTFIRTAVTGQNQLVETLKKYNSMQELRSVDTTDAPMQHRPVRMSLQQDAYFDPENDVDILERQYKVKRTQDYNRISEEPVDVSQLQHSQSDNVISFSTSNTEVIDKEPTSFSGGEIEHTSGYMYDTSNMSKSYDGTYSSATLPRMRRQKKPIYETMPTQRTTRTRRSSKKQ